MMILQSKAGDGLALIKVCAWINTVGWTDVANVDLTDKVRVTRLAQLADVPVDRFRRCLTVIGAMT